MLDGVRLTARARPRWTAADEAGLQAWMRAYLTWLTDSPHGQAEGEERQQPRDVVRRAGRGAGALHRTAGSRAADPRRLARADRSPDRAGRTSAARARAHALVALQRVQPDGVLQPGDARRARRRRPVELPNRRRPQPPAGGSISWCPTRPANGNGRTRKSPTSAPASSTGCCAAPRRRGRSRSTERLPRR